MNNILTGHNAAKKAKEEYAWTVYTKKAIEIGKPIWESRWSMGKLNERKKFYIDSGTPAKFYQEYMNQARSPDDAVFSEEDINESLYNGVLRWDDENGKWYIKSDEGNTDVN